MGRLSVALRAISEVTGNIVAWLTVPMVVGTFVVVVLRYVFDLGWIWMQESIVWMHAVVFMLAAAYALKRDEHVRVDIFYRRMSHRGKAWVNFVGTLVFLLPMSIFLIASSWDYVTVSWAIHEGSREAGGLPYPFVPVLKSVIPTSFALVILQGIADLVDSAMTLWSARGGGIEHEPPVHAQGGEL
jgi:TRAP-type mannitol/chloroaromatic compound transport system permease small subunit